MKREKKQVIGVSLNGEIVVELERQARRELRSRGNMIAQFVIEGLKLRRHDRKIARLPKRRKSSTLPDTMQELEIDAPVETPVETPAETPGEPLPETPPENLTITETQQREV